MMKANLTGKRLESRAAKAAPWENQTIPSRSRCSFRLRMLNSGTVQVEPDPDVSIFSNAFELSLEAARSTLCSGPSRQV
jgi:hypothetical protein